MQGIRRHGDRWQINFRYKGERVWETLPPGATLKEARALRVQRLNDVNTGRYLTSQITVRQLLEEFIADRRLTGRAPNTLRAYWCAAQKVSAAVITIKRENEPVTKQQFGHLPIRELTTSDVRALRDELLDPTAETAKVCRNCRAEKALGETVVHRGRRDGHDDVCLACRSQVPARAGRHRPGSRAASGPVQQRLSAKTAKDYLAALSAACEWACGQDPPLLLRNVARLVALPRALPPEIRPLTLEHGQQLLRAMRDWGPPYGCMLAVGFLTQLRTESEWGGMPRRNVDLENKRAALTQVLLGDGEIVAAGNSKHKRREIDIPNAAVPFIQAQLEWADGWYRRLHGLNDDRVIARDDWADYQRWKRDGLLFCSERGERIPPTTLRRKFRQLLRQVGFEPATVHHLRHWGAVLLLALGEHPKAVQERLGHATFKQTMDTYAPYVPGLAAAAGNRLGQALEAPAKVREIR